MRLGCHVDRFRAADRITLDGRSTVVAVGWLRFLGLARLDYDSAPGALLIPRCSSIHTFGMRFAIDVHFFDPRGRLLASRAGLAPGRVAFCWGAAAVLEVPVRPARRPSGTRGRSDVHRG